MRVTSESKSSFADEIRQQPRALRALLRHLEQDTSLHSQIAYADRERVDSVLFLGMGSSLYGAMPAIYALGERGVRARACDASEYLYYFAPSERAAPTELSVLISQSGQSPELVKLAGLFNRAKRPFIALTNDKNSRLARDSQSVLCLQAGKERGPSTKSYTNTVAACMALAAFITDGEIKSTLAAVCEAASDMSRLRLAAPTLDRLVEAIRTSARIDIVARGPALSTAYQASLLLRELAGMRVTAMSAGLFRHGPVYATRPRDVVIVLSTAGPTHDRVLTLVKELIDREVNVFLLSDGPIEELPDDRVLAVPPIGPLLFPLTGIVPFEFIGLELCKRLNCDPGHGVAKVTRTE